MRILIVEDEPKIADALCDGLEAEQYAVSLERTGEEAFFRASTESFDLIVMDLGLHDRDGLTVVAALRGRGVNTPVMVLTARDTVDARVAGFDVGADHYVVKPFAFEELLARMRALLRRDPAHHELVLTVGPLCLDVVKRTLTRNGELLDLTTKEFDVIQRLMRVPGEVVSRDTLAREIWQEPARSTSLDNVIDAHMARLRRKIDVDPATSLIHTVRGIGFELRAT